MSGFPYKQCGSLNADDTFHTIGVCGSPIDFKLCKNKHGFSLYKLFLNLFGTQILTLNRSARSLNFRFNMAQI